MIRPAQQKDIAQIGKPYHELYEQMQKYEPEYMKSSHQDEGFLRSAIGQENNFVAFVYETGSEINGFAIAQMQETPKFDCFAPQKCVYLMDIVVAPHKRGQGIGKALMQKIEKWAKEMGVDYPEHNVLITNEIAIKLYTREGYTSFSKSMRKRIA